MLRLLAARPPALRCLRLGVPSAARSVLRAVASPSGARADQGLDHRVPQPGSFTNGDGEISQVPGGPLRARAVLFDPGETSAPGHCGAPVLPSAFLTASALARTSLSRLDRTAHELAVYASQPESPPNHARLASGGVANRSRAGLGTRWVPIDVSDSCFHGSSSSSKLSWRTKNWLFAETVGGAEASANLYSVVETAKANGLEPWAYLQHIFAELPKARSFDDVDAFLPDRVALRKDVLR